MAIMFKKMIQAEKERREKRREEIAKFSAEWYARPYLDRVKRPAITFAVSLVLGLYFAPHSEGVSAIMFVIAFVAGFKTFGYALGARPYSPVEMRESMHADTHDPINKASIGNIFHHSRN